MKVLGAFCLALLVCCILCSYLEAHQTNVNVEVSVETEGHVQQQEATPPAAPAAASDPAETDSIRSRASRILRPISSAFNTDSILARWFRSFRKRWTPSQLSRRKAVFQGNLDKIIEHNRNPYRWVDLGLNQYSDLSPEEFAQKMGTSNVQRFVTSEHSSMGFGGLPIVGSANPSAPLPTPKPKPINIDPLTGEGGIMSVPFNEAEVDEAEDDSFDEAEFDQATGRTGLTSLDWSAVGKVVPVRDQGTCDGCWAFAASDALSSAYSLKLNQRPAVLSPQYLIDCNNQPDAKFGLANFGCSGGAVQTTFRFLANNPHILEKVYPYTKMQGNRCKATRRTARTKFTTASLDRSYMQVTGAAAIYSEISKGPMVIYLNCHGEEFRHYKKGIIASKCDTGRASNDNGVNHAVLLVGYGKEDGVDYWLIKNQWNTAWGIKGYAKIRRGVNMCEIETMAIRPLID